jgi:NAD(P)-binding Rossmann-like domain
MDPQTIEADYLIIGSGAAGMAFVDTLLKESDASIVMVDRHHGPGGHWNDAYPFVRLHQPSAYYGVNSKKLGNDTKDATGLNAGMYERATSAEIVSYYQQLMQEFLANGRVQYFPMCDYVGGGQFKSLMSGDVRRVNVRRKLVDTTYFNTAVPSTHPPRYAVASGVKCVPVNELPRVKHPHSGYVVVGSGKTGIDACLWLLENGAAPDAITWIMPRDAWYMNRAYVQPGEDFFAQSFGSFTEQMEAVAQSKSVADLFVRLSASGQLLRLDERVEPTMYHGAIMSEGEMKALKRITNIVRLGRILRIEKDQIVLEKGSIPSDADRLYVDCSASAVERRPAVPVFDGNKITVQMVRTFQPTFSAALIGYVEARYEDEAEKNELCCPIPMSGQPIHWLTMMAVNMANQHRWSKNKDLRAWVAQSRLDGFTAMAHQIKPTDTEKMAILQRYAASAGPAAANLQNLLA